MCSTRTCIIVFQHSCGSKQRTIDRSYLQATEEARATREASDDDAVWNKLLKRLEQHEKQATTTLSGTEGAEIQPS